MQEFGRVDSPVVLLRQVGLKHLWPDHHMKMWSEHHASSRIPREPGEHMVHATGASCAAARESNSPSRLQPLIL
jgi:hypothetical protein